MRDSATNLVSYHNQMKENVLENPEFNFILSIYENDSLDDTTVLLNRFDWSFLSDISIINETLNAPKFGSIAVEERVKNLSSARNKAITAKNFLEVSDLILMVESDMKYDIGSYKNLLNFKKKNSLKNVDIVSAVSWHNTNGKRKHYDAWGTRITENDLMSKLKKGWKHKSYDQYYGTCNGLCLFKSEPFKKGARYGWYNERLKTFDCDTIVICEEFHKMGYHDIFIDYTVHTNHI